MRGAHRRYSFLGWLLRFLISGVLVVLIAGILLWLGGVFGLFSFGGLGQILLILLVAILAYYLVYSLLWR